MLLNQLHLELSRVDLKRAHACLIEYEKSWGTVGLTWEPGFLDFWTVNGPPAGLDEGWALWLKLQGTEFWPQVPLSVRLAFKIHYFQTVLDRVSEDAEIRTSNGISKGYLHFLAGRLDSSLALLKKEVADWEDDPLPHLYLGNTQYLLSDSCAARDNYRDALLKGLEKRSFPEILDADVREFLAEVEPGEWAVVEGCISGVFPVTHLRSAAAVTDFVEKHAWLSAADSGALPSPVRQFYACLVLSESRAFVPEDRLMKARLHMKFLNGRLHKQHMDTLDGKRPGK